MECLCFIWLCNWCESEILLVLCLRLFPVSSCVWCMPTCMYCTSGSVCVHVFDPLLIQVCLLACLFPSVLSVWYTQYRPGTSVLLCNIHSLLRLFCDVTTLVLLNVLCLSVCLCEKAGVYIHTSVWNCEFLYAFAFSVSLLAELDISPAKSSHAAPLTLMPPTALFTSYPSVFFVWCQSALTRAERRMKW